MRIAKLLSLSFTTFLTTTSFHGIALHAEVPQEPYAWSSVPIVGGGFVDGIVFHPAEKDLRYVRTDMGGAYRWSPEQGKWVALMDWVPLEDTNLWGIESLALDPNNPDNLYLACGTYTRSGVPFGAILISRDRGETFRRINMPFKFGANENGRGNGERMAVDPNNSNILFLGTRHDGLWRSPDAGLSWSKVGSFPFFEESNPHKPGTREFFQWMWQEQGAGLISVIFDPASATPQGSAHIIVAASLMEHDNLFESFDGGLSWAPVQGHPHQLRVTDAALASNGTLYLTYGDNPGPGRMRRGEVWKWNLQSGQWTEITPEKTTPEHMLGYAGVSVDATDPDTLIVSNFHHPVKADLYRSTDGGASWVPLFSKGGAEFDYSKAPYASQFPVHWMFDVEIDPFNPDHAMVTTGYGGHETYNLTDADSGKPTVWQIMSSGIEETVALDLLSPPEGAPLITAVGDYNGFVHWTLDTVDPTGGFSNPLFNNTESLDCAWLQPENLVRVGRSHRGGPTIGYSTDMGKSWQPAGVPFEGAGRGFVSVSADGSTWIWAPMGSTPYRSTDCGQSWEPCAGLNVPEIRVESDKVNPDYFYAFALEGQTAVLYTSSDAGKSFSREVTPVAVETPAFIANVGHSRGDGRGAQDQVYATPGIFNELWIPSYDGLYHKASGSKTFNRVSAMSGIHAFGFGKAHPDADYQTLYILGELEGKRGIYRSIDKGASWTLINDEAHQFANVFYVIGDPKTYGRVYIGTHGRGTFYGDPQND